ncbi:FadR/GntR family transcriptional regulator [Microbacterium sp. CCNWLW134]
MTVAETRDPEQSSGYTMRGLQGRVIEAIGRAIIRGDYAPGELVPKEAELTEAYGVSRTSVREAMRVLAAKGLVDIRQKVGTRVRRTEQWNVFDADILRWHSDEGRGESILRDLVEVRQIMEPEAARLAAGRASMEDLRRLETALGAMRAATADRESYAHADVDFHVAVYGASHNVLLRQFGAVIADFMYLSFSVQQQTASGEAVFAGDVEQHAAVLHAIHRGRGEQAAEAMLDVVLDGKTALIQALSGSHDDRT